MNPQKSGKARRPSKQAKPGKRKAGQPNIARGERGNTSDSEAYAKLLNERVPEDIRLKHGLPTGATWADGVARGMIRAAVKAMARDEPGDATRRGRAPKAVGKREL